MELNTEGKIINAAEVIFVRDGYDGARMQDIADEAGINKALLHYYFRSKEKLFEQILHRKLHAFLPGILVIVEADTSVLEKFEAMVDGYIQMLSQNPQLPIFILFSAYRNPSIVQHMPKEVFTGIINFLKQSIKRGELKKVDPEHLLLSIMGMCIFPYVARPVASHMLGRDEREYLIFLKNRKREVMSILEELVI